MSINSGRVRQIIREELVREGFFDKVKHKMGIGIVTLEDVIPNHSFFEFFGIDKWQVVEFGIYRHGGGIKSVTKPLFVRFDSDGRTIKYSTPMMDPDEVPREWEREGYIDRGYGNTWASLDCKKVIQDRGGDTSVVNWMGNIEGEVELLSSDQVKSSPEKLDLLYTKKAAAYLEQSDYGSPRGTVHYRSDERVLQLMYVQALLQAMRECYTKLYKGLGGGMLKAGFKPGGHPVARG